MSAAIPMPAILPFPASSNESAWRAAWLVEVGYMEMHLTHQSSSPST